MGLPTLPKVFFSLFSLTSLSRGNATQQCLSFRALPIGRYSLFTKSLIRSSSGRPSRLLKVHPFFLTLEEELLIEIYWRENGFRVWINENDLSSLEKAIMDIFLKCWQDKPLKMKETIDGDEDTI